MPRLFNQEIPYAIVGGGVGVILSLLIRELMKWQLYSHAENTPGYVNSVAFHRARIDTQVAAAPITPILGAVFLFLGRLYDAHLQSRDSGRNPPLPLSANARNAAIMGGMVGLAASFLIYQYSMFRLHREAGQVPGLEVTAEYQSRRADLFEMSGPMSHSFATLGALVGLLYSRFMPAAPETEMDDDAAPRLGAGPGHSHVE